MVGAGDRKLPQQIRVDLVSWRRFRGVRFSIKRFDPHPLHQRGNVESPDLEAFLNQQALQHPAARKRELHVQLVDAVHQLQVGIRHRARLVIDTAPADPQHKGLAADAELRCGINHLFALGSRPALPSAPDKKSFSSVSSPILACNVLTSITGSGSLFAPSPNTPVAPSSN